MFTFEGGSPWWRETLTHHAEQKTRKSLELKGQTSFHLRGQNLIKVKEGAKQDRREKENYEKEVFYRRVNWSCFF